MSEHTYERPDNTRTVIFLLLILACMIGLVWASVPLYKLFCAVTGYGGTTQQAVAGQDIPVLDRDMRISFNADIDPSLPWYFKPVQRSVTIKVGEEALVFYRAVNNSDETITGTATFNVTPYKAGGYFNKIECFCFTEQTLKPGQSVDMPVTFYVDPELDKDEHLDEVKEITLSYTFFRSDEEE